MSTEESNENIEEFEKEILKHRLKMVNYKSQIATMIDDGSVMILSIGALPDGQPTRATKDISPKDPEFIDICKTFKLNKPGDSYYKTYKLVDRNWILESEGKEKD